MYGEDTLVPRSVWSDNKDGVFLDNKPLELMGLGALDDKIISAESPDEDE